MSGICILKKAPEELGIPNYVSEIKLPALKPGISRKQLPELINITVGL